ncbi:MAG: methylated-DNA--[Clostridia bacterium]|nr:methylated-DNA--[protein]-cysteine S-methyltransferase [Clostridia bacterium]
IASDGEHIVGLWIKGQPLWDTLGEIPTKKDDLALFFEAKAWLDRYFACEKPTPGELPLKPMGSDFRKSVWRHLLKIPYGKTTTYGAIAEKVAREMGKEKMSAQAVGGAVGHNPISIIIPCHRVVGAGGNLVGYTGGLEKKIFLLGHEGVKLS